MAVAPVADIRYYDTIYQERYCGLPQDHQTNTSKAPITFAGQLKGQLLVVHGTATTTFITRGPKRSSTRWSRNKRGS